MIIYYIVFYRYYIYMMFYHVLDFLIIVPLSFMITTVYPYQRFRLFCFKIRNSENPYFTCSTYMMKFN